MLMRYVAAFSMLAASGAVLADTLDINLNNNTAQLRYGTGTATQAQGTPDFHVGLLYNNSNSLLANAGILVANNIDGAPGLSIGVGLEVLAAIIKDNPPTKSAASAVAVDAVVRYSPPAASQFGVFGELNYGPRIVAFGDATRYTLAGTGVQYELSPQTLVYVEYRRISFGIKDGPNAVLDYGWHLGLKLSF